METSQAKHPKRRTTGQKDAIARDFANTSFVFYG
jgi:hypothetical protein